MNSMTNGNKRSTGVVNTMSINGNLSGNANGFDKMKRKEYRSSQHDEGVKER